MLTVPQQLLLNSIRSLQTTQDYSDLRIICGDRVFNVHKAVVCPRFDWFAKACNWGKNEEVKSEINLEDDDPRLVGLMVDYMYQLDYNDVVKNELPPILQLENDEDRLSKMTEAPSGVDASSALDPASVVEAEIGWGISSKKRIGKKGKKKGSWNFGTWAEPPEVARKLQDTGDVEIHKLTINTLMYALAEKYMIEDLKKLATKKFMAAAETSWQTKAFVYAAELVFETTPDSNAALRDVIIASLDEHPELVEYEEIENLLDSGNGIAWSFVKVLIRKLESYR